MDLRQGLFHGAQFLGCWLFSSARLTHVSRLLLFRQHRLAWRQIWASLEVAQSLVLLAALVVIAGFDFSILGLWGHQRLNVLILWFCFDFL